jgi:hypothetical protein
MNENVKVVKKVFTFFSEKMKGSRDKLGLIEIEPLATFTVGSIQYPIFYFIFLNPFCDVSVPMI